MPQHPDVRALINNPRSYGAFLRLWLVMFFSYVLLKFAFNLGIMGWIDLRLTFLWEILLMPLGLAVTVWLVARGRAHSASGDTSA
jgi:hypothetical protein